jgi:hypothetical protein
MSRRHLAIILVALTLAAPLAARGTPENDTQSALDRARTDAVAATRTYLATLERLLVYREDAVQWAVATLENRRRLLAMGGISRADVEATERDLQAAQATAAATRGDIRDAEQLLAEAIAAAALPPLAPGVTASTATVVQHRGRSVWSLARVDVVKRFFAERFGRPLPISALGQTRVHDRLGSDHRNALDVAVHPDSPEGRALIAWLEREGVSFLAFRGPVSGEATGAHVHVGEPSRRRAGPHA